MYNENGHTYSFDREYARSIIEQIVRQENADSTRYASTYYHSQKRCTKGEIYHLIADYVPISQDAVKNGFRRQTQLIRAIFQLSENWSSFLVRNTEKP